MGSPFPQSVLTGNNVELYQGIKEQSMGDIRLVQKEQTGESGVKTERKMHILEKRVTPLFSDCLTDN